MAGNANSGSMPGRANREFLAALRVALNSKGEGVRLRKIAENLVSAALTSEQWAIQEVANRLDGKPAQIIAGDEDRPLNLVTTIRRIIIDGEVEPDPVLITVDKPDDDGGS